VSLLSSKPDSSTIAGDQMNCIHLTKLLIFLAITPTAFAAERWIELFNGTNLENWGGAPALWRVEKGILIGETTKAHPLKHHSYLIWRGGVLKDFELRLQFRVPGKHGNSGVQYRSRDLGNYQVAGYQCNIHPRISGSTAVLEEMKNGRGGHLAGIGQRVELSTGNVRQVLGKTGEPAKINASLDQNGWNDLVIRAEGPRLRHWLNGHLAIDAVDNDSKAAPEGVLALQVHSGPPMRIEFRNIRLRKLDTRKSGTDVK
jgi:hypothetical protein